jgi:hypothetical protein
MVRSVSPPIRPGTLGPPATMTVTPVVPQSLQTLPVTVDGLTTPILTLSQPATSVPIPSVPVPNFPIANNPVNTGARIKSPTIPTPPPIPTPDRVTRSATNSHPRQYHQELVNAGKNIVTSMKSKNKRKDSKKARSVSEDSKI